MKKFGKNINYKNKKSKFNCKSFYCLLIIFIILLTACGTSDKKNDDNNFNISKGAEHDPLNINNNEDKLEQVSPTIIPKNDDSSDDSVPVSSITDPTSAADPEVTVLPEVTVSPEVTEPTTFPEPTRISRDEITDKKYEQYSNTKNEWGFKREKNNIPSGTYEPFRINDYDAFYLNSNVSDDDKVIYLTFDCGYENGYTPSLLDTLKAHNAKAMFFVTKQFIKENSDLVIRIKEEGHMVGNHTLNHYSMPTLSIERLKDEIVGCEELMKEKTGYDLDMFIRPPKGEYSEKTLKISQDLGYATIFWSIVYVDYDVDNQPGKDFVINQFKTYHHNGAIPLIHNVSQSNAEALNEVLTYLESEGYRFGTLDELMKSMDR